MAIAPAVRTIANNTTENINTKANIAIVKTNAATFLNMPGESAEGYGRFFICELGDTPDDYL